MAKAEKIGITIPNRAGTVTGLRIALLVGVSFVAILTAYLTFASVRDFVASWQITNLPGISVSGVSPTQDAANPQAPQEGAPPELAAAATPPPRDGADGGTLLAL